MKRIFISIFALLAVINVAAQNDDISRQIEVTRDYTPKAALADKLDILPQMADTVQLHPQVDYSITPTAWMSVYAPAPISAVGMSAVRLHDRNTMYAEFGAGLPLRSVADIYFSPKTMGETTLGVYLNHDGIEGKIKNDYGDKRSALMLDSRIGAYVQSRFERGGGLKFDVEYGMRDYDPYGGFSQMADGSDIVYGGRISYDDIRSSFTIGSDFTDLSRFNVRFGVSGGYFKGATAGEALKQGQWDVNTALDVGIPIAGMPLLLGVEYNGFNGLDQLKGQNRNTIQVSGLLGLANSRRVKLGIGAKYITTESEYIVPMLKFDWLLAGGVNPYINIDGGVADNSYRGLTLLNPYVQDGVWLKDYNAHVDMRTGINFTTSVADFDIHAGYDMHDEYNLFVNMDKTSRFVVYGGKAKIFYAAVSSDFVLGDGLSLKLSGRYNSVEVQSETDNNLRKLYEGTGIPQFTADGWLEYAKGKISLKAGVQMLGERTFASAMESDYMGSIVSLDGLTFNQNVIDGSVNVGFEGRYEVNENLGIFVRGDNLLGQKIYLYNYYPYLGTNILIGVRVNL